MSAAAQRYDRVAQALHWVIALLVCGLLIAGLAMKRGELPTGLTFQLYQLHKSTGITVLALSLLRLVWRLTHKPPPLPAAMPGWERRAAAATHLLFYLLLIGMPLGGWLMVSASPLQIPTLLYGAVELPHLPIEPSKATEAAFKRSHSAAGFLMLGLLALHIGAALRHHFIVRDGVLGRMLPGLSRSPNRTAS